MPTSLVTGGAGFIGAHVTNDLIAMGHEVIVLDDLSGGFRGNVNARAAFVEGSVTDHALLARLFSEHRFDCVYHLAAYAAEGLSHFIRRFNYTNNLIGSANLINEAVKHEVKCFVFTSSIAVYGAIKPPMREEDVPHPEDPYGIAKLAVEQDLAAAQAMFGLPYVIFRPHNVYGEYQNIGDPYRNVVGIFMRQLMEDKPLTVFGDGSQTRAFSYIGDVSPHIANAVNIPAAHNQVFNIGADIQCTVNELAGMTMRAMGVSGKTEHLPPRNEVVHAWADHGKVKRLFGIDTSVSLEEGLLKMAAWVKGTGVRESKRMDNIEIEKGMPAVWRDDSGDGDV